MALSPQKQEIVLGKGERSSGVGGRALPRAPSRVPPTARVPPSPLHLLPLPRAGQTPAPLEKPRKLRVLPGVGGKEQARGKPAGLEHLRGRLPPRRHPCVSEEQNKPGAGSCRQPAAHEWA